MNKQEYTAEEAASFLLRDTGLSEWQIGFLAVALDEVAEWHERIGKTGSIACCECADELTHRYRCAWSKCCGRRIISA